MGRGTVAGAGNESPRSSKAEGTERSPRRWRALARATDQPTLVADGGPYTLAFAIVTGSVRWVVPPSPAFYMLAVTAKTDRMWHVS
jgi:hypothetical protein